MVQYFLCIACFYLSNSVVTGGNVDWSQSSAESQSFRMFYLLSLTWPIGLFLPRYLQQYFVKEKEEKTGTGTKPVEVKEVEVPKETASQEAVAEKTVEATTAVTEGSSEVAPAAEESTESNSDASEGTNNATTEQSGEDNDENSTEPEAAEETPQIKVAFT